MTAVNDSETTYVFGPRERHALLLGMRLSQLLLVAEGAVLLLLGLLSESGAGVLLRRLRRWAASSSRFCRCKAGLLSSGCVRS